MQVRNTQREYGSVCRIDKPFMGNQFADFGVRAYV